MALSHDPTLPGRLLSWPLVLYRHNMVLSCTRPAVHFWAPTFKWGITFANIADLQRPADKISVPQQCAIAATGVIWSRYSTQITPVNYNLLLVNVFMAVTGSYQLFRKWRHDQEVSAASVAATKQ